MQLLSVQETAFKFRISERRVQKLCESGRIRGAQRISNVWLIPEDAEKPTDGRIIHRQDGLISLNELCKELSISVATGRNWVKLGKLMPEKTVKRTHFFTEEYAATIKADIQNGKNAALKSRRNKRYVSGNNIYHSYVSENSQNVVIVEQIIRQVEDANVEITDELLLCLLAECAVQITGKRTNDFDFPANLAEFEEDGWRQKESIFFINDLLDGVDSCKSIMGNYPMLFSQRYEYEEAEDVLGFLYLSLRNMGSRKATGSYYTPSTVVKKLCSHLFSDRNLTDLAIFDPCCGTGNFILQLPAEIVPEHVFGNDIDSISVKLARINYSLKYGITDRKFVCNHITHGDYLKFDRLPHYDIILGNPPWGFVFSDEEKNRLTEKYQSAVGANVESYDLFVEQALSNLHPNGILAFVLPEAILNVKAHKAVRESIMEAGTVRYLSFLGNAFYKVQCPCIIMQICRTDEPFDTCGMKVEDGKREFCIRQSRDVSSDYFSFMLTDEEYAVLNKLNQFPKATTLKGQAIFALGIVTGNNKEYLSDVQTEGSELVLKGSDIYKYRVLASGKYISFKPEVFQQTAPTEYYRAPEKLLYRFICNQLVFAYDDKQTLSLNSGNLVIPQIKGLSVRYVLTILNSRVAQFYFQKMFHSVKVLRSHIEAIPIPVASLPDQKMCEEWSLRIEAETEKEKRKEWYELLDRRIGGLFDLTEQEYLLIKNAVEQEEHFI